MTEPSADPTLADRFRSHARALIDGGRSPRYVELMPAAADDLDRGGVVARLFAVSLHAEPDGPGQILARCGDHGPPVVWNPPAPTAG